MTTGKRTALALVLMASGLAAGCGGAAPVPIELAEKVEVPTGPAVDLRVRVQPEHSRQVGRYQAAAHATLTAYATRFRAMPFTSLTVVDPGWHAAVAPSQPTSPSATVFAATSWLAPVLTMEPEVAVVGAIGSTFWHEVLSCHAADNWFVEGLNRYTSMPVIATQFAFQQTPPAFSYLEQRYFNRFVPKVIRTPRRIGTVGGGLADYRANPKVDVRRVLRDSERRSAVAKTALALGTLEGWVGSPTWDAVLAAFAEKQWTACPSPDDLERVADEVTGLDLSWFFRQVFDSSDVFDYAVDRLSSDRDEGTGAYRTTVVVRRLGEAEFTGTSAPRTTAFESGRGMELVVRFEDGSERVDRWDGRDRLKTFVYESAQRAQSAEVDPRHVLLLDMNRVNNSVSLAPTPARAATIWSGRWSLWLQDLLLTYAFFS